MGKKIQTEEQPFNKESFIVWCIYIFFTLCSISILVRIAYIQISPWKKDPLLAYYRSSDKKSILEPNRGAILSIDGKPLAVSVPMYQIYMDCTVRKEEFRLHKKKGPEKEREWRGKAKGLAKGLAAIFPSKSSDSWYDFIIEGRERGRRYIRIGDNVDHETLQKLKALPLFNEGANKGGLIEKHVDTRQYPYGSLARRTIGYVRTNKVADARNAVGIEGKFNYVLHGKEGQEWLKRVDGRSRIVNRDSTSTAPEDGKDIRTTLDIDIQDIADDALRSMIAENPKVDGGCAVVMDVESGAIRAMVNLQKDSLTGRLGETTNMAIGKAGEPGSIFKTAILMSLLEDGKVKLSDKIPTNHGRLKYFSQDTHVPEYEKNFHTDKISVMYGFEKSFNYVFRKLAIDHYGDNPKKLLDNLYLYKLGETYDIDIDGFATPVLPSPSSKTWSATDLGSVAIGYTVAETPLHMLTFYNAIANKGRMMKPYLVESIESNGDVDERRGPSVLNGAICSRATADSLTKGLMKITEEGTAAYGLKGAKCKVAGKTGTARMIQDGKNAMKGNPYRRKDGTIQYQASFVGFFPADKPKYSAIVVVYSHPGHGVLFGGSVPTAVYRKIVDNVYAIDRSEGEIIEKKGRMPELSVGKPATAASGHVPNVQGLGLMEAAYAIETDGYICSYSGMGHVVSQNPAPGTKYAKGNTVNIRLE